jgi:hypothetical protein
MHDMCDTREMREARKSRSSRACRASSRDPCMRDVWGMPRPADLRACEASDPTGYYTYEQGRRVRASISGALVFEQLTGDVK